MFLSVAFVPSFALTHQRVRRFKTWLVALGTIVALGAGGAWLGRDELFRRQARLRPFTHTAGESDIVMVTMRDGVRLHTEVFRPADAPSFPLVLVRNPYVLLRPLERFHCRILTRYGYGCVLQDVRGQMESEGEWQPILNERNDGLDTLAWLVRQPWHDGNIAMRGPSYLTCVQLVMADALPPEVKTLVPSVFGLDFRWAAYERGLFHHDFLTAWATFMPERGARLTAGADYLKAAAHRPAMEADEKYMTKVLPWYRALLTAEAPSSPYWQSAQQTQFRTIPERAGVPMLFIGAFFDPFFASQLDTWQRLATRNESVLVIGPWDHLNLSAGDVEPFVETGRFDPWPLMLEWFDHHLKQQPLSTLTKGTVRTLSPYDRAWRTHSVWPDRSLPQTQLHLGRAASSQSCEGGSLEPEPTTSEQTSYVYDPQNPTPSSGGASMLSFAFFRELRILPGPLEQGSSCQREDVLTFRSTAFEKPMRLSGAAKLELLVQSTAPDTAFVARLIAEYEGRSLLVREAAATLAFPTSREEVKVTPPPGTPTHLELDFWPVEWAFPKGARLRIDLTSSSFPALHSHSNRAGPWALQTGTDVATQTILFGEGRSVLTLPLIDDAP